MVVVVVGRSCKGTPMVAWRWLDPQRSAPVMIWAEQIDGLAVIRWPEVFIRQGYEFLHIKVTNFLRIKVTI